MAVKFFSKVTEDLASTICLSLELVTIVMAIIFVIGGFSEEHQKWLAHVTVQLHVANYSQLSDYNFAD